nr:hypothetical protein [Candidatus Sigynarchaeota archaeon]
METLINKIDWSVLEKHKVLDKDEAMSLLKIADIDPDSTITKMRSILERILKFIFKRHFNMIETITSDEMIRRLGQGAFLPKPIYLYMNTIRISGNLAHHPEKEIKVEIFSKEDVVILMPLFTHIIDWFVSTLIDEEQESNLGTRKKGKGDGESSSLIDQDQKTRIDTFINERVELVRSSRIQIPHFGFASERIVLHLFPLNSIKSLKLFSPEMKREIQLCYPIGFSKVDKLSSNAEGLEANSSIQEGDRFWVGHVQLYKDGVFESVSCVKTYTDYVKERNIDYLRIEAFETDCVSGLGRFLNLYSRIGISPPLVLIFTLINFRSFKLVFYKDSKPYYEAYKKEVVQSFDKESKVLTFAPILLDNFAARPDVILRPIFDQIWNTCGFTHSLSYDDTGNWNPANIVRNFENEDFDYYAFL